MDRSQRRVRRRLPVAVRVVLGLLLLILVGTGLLMAPGVTTRPLTFMDALFTAASALTVTGLSVVTVSVEFTPLGQWLLLLLIQVGGVGYMFMAALALRLIGRRVALLNRLALSTSLGLDSPGGILRVLRRTFFGILAIEGAGALLLWLYWEAAGITPPERGVIYALFHAVSAFCNAGFDLFAGLSRYPEGIPNDDISLLIMGTLIFVGGLGIPVISDLFTWRRRGRLTMNTRVTLVVVTVLVLLGWIGLYLPETRPGGVLYDAPWDQQLVHTWFQSVSTRTAGFPGLADFEYLAPETQLVVMSLMFIGCAPASMGGGITTGTFVVLMLAVWSYARGLPTAQVGKRAIAIGTVRRAGAVLTISIGAVIVATWALLMTHDFTLNTALFEVVSAFATCGLSLGVTEELNTFGRLVIILMMFWGRLGALTIVIAIAQPSRARRLVKYPETSILIG
jgi:trk system potassium uptake protein TrkH